MHESQISVRYAKALFKSALEQNLIDRVHEDMLLLAEVCKVHEFKFMLETPACSSDQKSRITLDIPGAKISDLTKSLIKLVTENKRERQFPGIARNYTDIYKKYKGIKTASLVTASKMDEVSLNKLNTIVKDMLKADVDLSTSVDESVLGGFILTIEDQQYDASVANKLKKIRKELLKTPVVKR